MTSPSTPFFYPHRSGCCRLSPHAGQISLYLYYLCVCIHDFDSPLAHFVWPQTGWDRTLRFSLAICVQRHWGGSWLGPPGISSKLLRRVQISSLSRDSSSFNGFDFSCPIGFGDSWVLLHKLLHSVRQVWSLSFLAHMHRTLVQSIVRSQVVAIGF